MIPLVLPAAMARKSALRRCEKKKNPVDAGLATILMDFRT